MVMVNVNNTLHVTNKGYGLEIKAKKTKYMNIKNLCHQKYTVSIYVEEMERTGTYRYLGLMLNKELDNM